MKPALQEFVAGWRLNSNADIQAQIAALLESLQF